MRPPLGLPGLFVAGTDTDVGKTHVAAAIARSLVALGRRVGVYKPVASGFPSAAAEGSDAWRLWDAAGRPLTPDSVCPQAFAAAVAPHRSAAAEGSLVDERLLRTGLDAWLPVSDVVLVEAAGGLYSPMGDSTLAVDLARDFRFPVVIVDAARLGAVGRSLATVRAAVADGLSVAAVVLSHTTPVTADAKLTSRLRIALDSVDDLKKRLPGIPVVILDHGATLLPAGTDWPAARAGATRSPPREGCGPIPPPSPS
ncbi:MAG: dethiobiotin synthase [Pirellulales bacterium]